MDIRQGVRQAVELGEQVIAAVAVALSGLVVAVVVLLALASPSAQAQVLDSYTPCGTVSTPVCTASKGRAQACRTSARSENTPDPEAVLWAMSMHRASASGAGIALRSLRPATIADDAGEAKDTRSTTCS